MNAKALIPLVAGLAIGGLALKMGLDTLRSAKGAKSNVETVPVWAASDDLLRGTVITEGMIARCALAAETVPEGAITDKAQLVGRVPTLDVPRGLPILEHTLLPKGEKLRLRVKPGYRAVSVKIDEGSGVDFHLEPGSFVDVIGSFRVRVDGRRQETVATTILENVEVAAVGERISPQTSAEDEENSARRRRVRAVTLFVKPEDVQKLHITEQEGRIKLCLRSDQDKKTLVEQVWSSKGELTGMFTNPQTQEPEQPEQPEEPESSVLDWFAGLVASANSVDAGSVTPNPQPARVDWAMDIYRGGEKETKVFEQQDLEALLGPQAESSTMPPPVNPVGANVAPPAPMSTESETEVSASATASPKRAKGDGWALQLASVLSKLPGKAPRPPADASTPTIPQAKAETGSSNWTPPPPDYNELDEETDTTTEPEPEPEELEE